MKSYLCLLAAIFLSACVVIPVKVEKSITEGKRFTESDLEFVQAGATSREELTSALGDPTLWLPAQRILVYGLRQVDNGSIWFIGAGLTAAGGFVKGETKEAVYLHLDNSGVVANWGRSKVKRSETWLSAATRWAAENRIPVPHPRSQFAEAPAAQGLCLVYFYRPRDFQYYLFGAPPAKKLFAGIASFVEVGQNDRLLGQIHFRSYLALELPPGAYRFEINADTDDVVNPEIYRSAALDLELEAGSVTFIDIGIKAGLGKIEPIIARRTRDEALPALAELRESW